LQKIKDPDAGSTERKLLVGSKINTSEVDAPCQKAGFKTKYGRLHGNMIRGLMANGSHVEVDYPGLGAHNSRRI
jgi:hypothetical protein